MSTAARGHPPAESPTDPRVPVRAAVECWTLDRLLTTQRELFEAAAPALGWAVEELTDDEVDCTKTFDGTRLVCWLCSQPGVGLVSVSARGADGVTTKIDLDSDVVVHRDKLVEALPESAAAERDASLDPSLRFVATFYPFLTELFSHS